MLNTLRLNYNEKKNKHLISLTLNFKKDIKEVKKIKYLGDIIDCQVEISNYR